MNKILSVIFILMFCTVYAQKQKFRKFATNKEYSQFLEKEYGLNPEEVYYISTETKSHSFEKWGLLLFVSPDGIASVDDVSKVMGSSCPPKKLVKNMKHDDIQKAFVTGTAWNNVIAKNVLTGALLNQDSNEKYALYTFSYLYGSWGMDYIKQRQEIYKKFGFKPIILISDGESLDEIKDIDKEPSIIHMD